MKRYALTFLLLFAAPAASAGEAEGPRTRLGSGHDDDVFQAPRDVTVANHDNIQRWTVATTPELVETQPSTRVLYRFSGGGSPLLRALGGSRIALYVDGVRLNTAITVQRDDGLLATIDALSLSRLAITRGPSAVVHGSDAMGGVIAMSSAAPTFDARRAWDAAGGALLRFRSHDKGLVGHVFGEGHLRGIGARASLTLRRFDTLVAGRGLAEQPFSDYFDGAGNASAVYKVGERSHLRFDYHLVRRHDMPLADASTTRDFTVVDLRARDLIALRFERHSESKALRDVAVIVSLQSQREARARFRLDLDRVDRERDDVVSVGARALGRSKLPYNDLSYGVDVYHDRVSSEAEFELIAGLQTTQLARGRYVDGSSYTRFGAFVHDRFSIGKLALELGGRVAGWNVDIGADPATPLDAIKSTSAAVLGSARARYLVGDGFNIIAGIAQGIHAPNIADYTARGCGRNSFDVPNADLKPERSVTVEAGLKLDLFGVLRGALFYYFTHLDDAIVLRDTNTTQLCPDQGGVDRDVPVLTRDNVQSANIHGLEGRLALDLGKSWRVFGWVAWARGQTSLELPGNFSEPLSRTPPLGGLVAVRYSGQGWFAQADMRWAIRQDRLSTGDRADPTICPAGASGANASSICGTAGYAVVNLRGGFAPSKWLRVTLALQNLTDEPYYVHGSTVPGPGISAITGLEVLVK
ncbi:MAG: TonB-dependent receptor [Myxococcales bacterium]|nr:TonB-dependent receptor [Myxococcales bacterium]